jgi:hypothetical protein
MDETLILSFPEARKDRANVFADELRKELKRLDPTITVDKKRETEEAQDFGATLVAVLTSAAVTALAKGIANLIARHHTKITIRIGDEYVEAQGIESHDAAAIMNAMQKRQKK